MLKKRQTTRFRNNKIEKQMGEIERYTERVNQETISKTVFMIN